MVMLNGTVRLVLLLESETGTSPEGAAPFNETVQKVVPGVFTIRGLQLKALRLTNVGSVIVPEPPLDGMEVPVAEDVMTAVI